MRIKVLLLTFKRVFSVCVYKDHQSTSKPLALWCCNNVWEISVNGAVSFLKLLVLGI